MKRFLLLYTLLPVMRSIALWNQSKITKSLQCEIRNVIVIFITLFVWVDVSMRVCVWEWMCLCVSVCVCVCERACVSASMCVSAHYDWFFLLISSTGHHWLSRQCFHVKRKCNSRCESVKYYCHHYNIWYLHWLCCSGKRYKRETCNYYWINIKLLKGFDNYRIDICYAHIFKILHGV